MATKSCPSCGAEVPTAASRCKSCFHDFTEEPEVKKNPMMGMLAFVLALLLIGGGTFFYINQRSASEKIVVDQETASIVFIKKYADRTETNRVNFAEIQKVEHVFGGEQATFEVVAVASDGNRYVIKQSDEGTLVGYAEHVAAVMDKPMEDIRNVRGFGE